MNNNTEPAHQFNLLTALHNFPPKESPKSPEFLHQVLFEKTSTQRNLLAKNPQSTPQISLLARAEHPGPLSRTISLSKQSSDPLYSQRKSILKVQLSTSPQASDSNEFESHVKVRTVPESPFEESLEFLHSNDTSLNSDVFNRSPTSTRYYNESMQRELDSMRRQTVQMTSEMVEKLKAFKEAHSSYIGDSEPEAPPTVLEQLTEQMTKLESAILTSNSQLSQSEIQIIEKEIENAGLRKLLREHPQEQDCKCRCSIQ